MKTLPDDLLDEFTLVVEIVNPITTRRRDLKQLGYEIVAKFRVLLFHTEIAIFCCLVSFANLKFANAELELSTFRRPLMPYVRNEKCSLSDQTILHYIVSANIFLIWKALFSG